MKVIRCLLGLTVLGLLLCALASWWIGKHIEIQVRLGQAQLSEQLGVPVQLLEYRRGWFSSEARSRARLGAAADALVLIGQHHIHHGPLPAWRSVGLVSATSDVFITPEVNAPPSAHQANGVSLQIQSDVGLDQRVRLAVSGRPGHFTDASGAIWDVTALQGQLEMAPQLRSISAQLEWGGMQWSGAHDARVTIGTVALDGQYQLPAGRAALYDGHSKLQLAELAMRNVFAPDVPVAQQVPYAWQIDGLALSNRLSTQTAIGQASVSLKAQTMALAGLQTGPVQWAMSLEAIPVAGLAHLMPRLGAWISQQQQRPSAAEQTLTVAEQQAIQHGIAALFQQGLRLQLERASVALPAGEVVLEGSLEAPSLTGTDLSFLPMSLASKIDLSVRAQAPAVVAKDWQGSNTFEALLAQGLWLREGDSVNASLHYQRGLSTINSVPVQPASLAQWFGQ